MAAIWQSSGDFLFIWVRVSYLEGGRLFGVEVSLAWKENYCMKENKDR